MGYLEKRNVREKRVYSCICNTMLFIHKGKTTFALKGSN